MKIFRTSWYLLKDLLKDILHALPFVPYRKPSKRRKVWNRVRERRFLRRIDAIYLAHRDSVDAIEVSIVMPAYNRAFCIHKPIAGVLNQHHTNWELLIVDDGSTDGLASLIADKYNDGRIRYFPTEHLGVSHARNHGLERARGKYIFYLDTDNAWYPSYLRTMIVFMDYGGLDACYAGARIINDGNETIGYFGERFVWAQCWELNHIDINSFGHRKDVVGEGFRFVESLNRLVDWEFILALTANHRTAYAPFLGVEYYDGEKGSRITFTRYEGERVEELKAQIQNKHREMLNLPNTSARQLRPSWREALRHGEMANKG